MAKKQQSITTLKNKLDRVFSEYIRLRDSDKNGYCRCISCGAVKYWTELDNGHFINRSHMSLRFSEKNCNAQCRPCNRFDESNFLGYQRGLIGKYGVKIIADLEARKHEINKISAFEYEAMIKFYTKEVKIMKLNKNLRK